MGYSWETRWADYISSGKSWEYPDKENAFLKSSGTVGNFNLLHKFPTGEEHFP